MANLAFERFHNCFVLVQNQHTPTDAEWDQWLTFATRGGAGGLATMRVLIFSVGGTPTPKQRNRVHELSPKTGNGVRTAVVTPSLVGRTVVGAMGLFNKNVHAFSPTKAGQAFDHLGVPNSMHAELLECVRGLFQQLKLNFDVVL